MFEKKLTCSQIEFKFPKIKIVNKKCNKLNTIRIIEQKNHIDKNRIYTIGDDLNDIEMIKYYNGFSLVTASSEVKKYALGIYRELNELLEDINKSIINNEIDNSVRDDYIKTDEKTEDKKQ